MPGAGTGGQAQQPTDHVVVGVGQADQGVGERVVDQVVGGVTVVGEWRSGVSRATNSSDQVASLVPSTWTVLDAAIAA